MATTPPKKPNNQVHPSIPESVLSVAQAVAMTAAAPGLRIGIAPIEHNTLGYVGEGITRLMVLNEDLPAITTRTGIQHTVPHEFEHILQNRVAARQKTTWDSEVVAEYMRLGGTTEALKTNLKRSASSAPLRERLQAIAGSTPAAYLGGLPRGQYSLPEQFAELSSLERYSGKDLTKDPVVRKEFFGNDEALISVYKATTGYRQERMDSKDLPPMTAQPSVTQTPAPSVPSVLDQILEAAKRVMK